MPNPPMTPSSTSAVTSKTEQAPTADNDIKMEEQTHGGTDNGVNGGDADYDVADDEDRWMAA